MKDDDVMIRITIQLTRDGDLVTKAFAPSGPVNCDVALQMGMLEIAKIHVMHGIEIVPDGAQA